MKRSTDSGFSEWNLQFSTRQKAPVHLCQSIEAVLNVHELNQSHIFLRSSAQQFNPSNFSKLFKYFSKHDFTAGLSSDGGDMDCVAGWVDRDGLAIIESIIWKNIPIEGVIKVCDVGELFFRGKSIFCIHYEIEIEDII